MLFVLWMVYRYHQNAYEAEDRAIAAENDNPEEEWKEETDTPRTDPEDDLNELKAMYAELQEVKTQKEL